MPRRPLPWLLCAAAACSALAGPGCGKRPPTQPTDRAEAAVEAFLDSWSRGEPPDKPAGPKLPVEASDPDRSAGYRLLSFLVSESKPAGGADRVRCHVALTLRDRQGRQVEKQVVYEVEVGEKSVIRRASP